MKCFHGEIFLQVIARIFYEVNRSWSGKITVSELRRSKFLSTLKLLQDEDDINQVTDFFSYEHFYVIYCKFWELDKDHDLFIDREDLSRHNEHGEFKQTITNTTKHLFNDKNESGMTFLNSSWCPVKKFLFL